MPYVNPESGSIGVSIGIEVELLILRVFVLLVPGLTTFHCMVILGCNLGIPEMIMLSIVQGELRWGNPCQVTHCRIAACPLNLT